MPVEPAVEQGSCSVPAEPAVEQGSCSKVNALGTPLFTTSALLAPGKWRVKVGGREVLASRLCTPTCLPSSCDGPMHYGNTLCWSHAQATLFSLEEGYQSSALLLAGVWDSKALARGGMFIPPDLGEGGREKKDSGVEGMKGSFLPQIGTTRQMKITCLGGFDKIEEKIAGAVFRAASGFLSSPPPVNPRQCFLLMRKPGG